MAKLPSFLKRYFWDVKFSNLDSKKRSTYIIERLLELGNINALHWVFKKYPQTTIKQIICQSPALSKKTANFWSLILDIPKNQIRCLQPDFQKIHKAIWPY
ncbi:MAG: hypothetical protein A2860_02150 [Candidatus Levybacteria bacterium RIFCSPHIGHO2_01_FULL_37_33]|nr:MAG: hypothetical protein A2860_02150 [Candidatus Levybacteria bacterium RIFCSPHIGHO2_01_FULL_37_33]OGH17197.1 MAG: hypothetical protein A3C97_00490 [Candidatus Levybacteria bacterium RIFCSPHIGHO2_02_FULL_37_11]OGH29554.1 MAG: hypothetical protein A3F30_02570 [Candidatus Levybacteria bacterium RIFCSPHIGHO2_12_FULL_37_12]